MVSSGLDESDDENSKIFRAIAGVLQVAQGTYAGHRKHVAVLKKIQWKAFSQGYEDAFNYWFNRLISKVLPLKKNELIGNRIVKLVAAFIASLERDLEGAREEGVTDLEPRESLFSKFVDQFVRHILRGTESRDRNVRYRVLQLLAVIMDNIGEIDEDLYNLLMWSLNKRIHDKEPNVRMQAVFCLTKFQDEEPTENNTEKDENMAIDDATHRLMVCIQNDSSAEVRRAALLNLVYNPVTSAYILERARDINQVNRRLIYSKILKSMGKKCFDMVDPAILDQLIKWGLEDREETVRRASLKLICHDWMNLLNGDLIEFVENLNVFKSNVADKVMDALFSTRLDIIPKLKFTEEVWTEFTIATAFLVRCFYIYCLNNDLLEVIETKFPEATKLADYIKFYIDKNNGETVYSKSEKLHLDFILEQLLTIANKYDYSDEIGRRAMLVVVRNLLGIKNLSDSLIKIGLHVLKSLSINERDFVSMTIEIINDIRDDDLEEQDFEKNNFRNSEDEEDEDAIENFSKSVQNLVDGKNTETNENSISQAQQDRSVRPEAMIQCLTRSAHLLALVELSLEKNILIASLIDTLITPAVRNNEPKIRELGIRNLGLCCLLDVQLATENLYILGMCVSKGNAVLKSIALQAIVDIFSIHGNAVVDGEGMVDSISLHKIFYRVLKNNELPECQVNAAEGLCKLYLADIFTDDDLFETLVLSYFSASNSSNEGLIQALAFCIPVYCFSHVKHQQRFGRVAADSLLRLCIIWDEHTTSDDLEAASQTMMKPNVIFQQFIDWTDPRKVIANEKLSANTLTMNGVSKNDVQILFLLDTLKLLPKFEKKTVKKMILTNLNSFYVTSSYKIELLTDVKEHIEDIIENEEIDNMTSNSLKKFMATVVEVIEQTNCVSDNGDTHGSDEEYSMILETSYADNGLEEANSEAIDYEKPEGSDSNKVDTPNKKRVREEIPNDLEIKQETSEATENKNKGNRENQSVQFILPDDDESDNDFDEMSIDESSYHED